MNTLTFTEISVVTEHMLNPQSSTYNINFVPRFKGDVSAPQIESALQKLLERHPILTASYPVEGGEIMRRVQEHVCVYMEQCACSPEELAQEIQKRNTPYDIARGPLYRFVLFTLGSQEYALLMGFHHLIMDGTSIVVFLKDLMDLYDDRALAPVKKDYFAHAAWQKAQAAHLQEQSAFFVDMFRDGIPQNTMPCHAIRPQHMPLTEKSVACQLTPAMLVSLKKQAHEAGVTVYTLVMAAASLTVSRYCNSEDVVLGTGLHGRTQDFMTTVGMFSKEMPVRTFPRHNRTFPDFLAELASTVAGVRAHQVCSLDAVIAQLQVHRETSRKLFFDVSVNYLQAFPSATMGDGIHMHADTFVGQTVPVDWAFEVTRHKEHLDVTLQYSPLLYDDGIAHDALELFTTILERIAVGEKGTLVNLTRLPERQETVLLHSFCGLRTKADADETLVSLFKKRVAQYPDVLAVVSSEQSYTYAELDHISDRLAYALVSRGAKKGMPVGILVGRNAFMAICALGVIKAGAAYVPLDPAYPAARLEFMLQDTGASFVLVDESLVGLLENFDGERILTQALQDMSPVVSEKAQAPLHLPQPEDVFVYLFTSGTTGTPKGVMWSHANFTNFCAWYRHTFALKVGDNMTAYASFGFDASAKELFVPLTAGATVHIVPEHIRLDFPALKNFYNTHGITISFLTTQLGRQFAALKGLQTLRTLTMGGEALTPFEPTSTFSLYNVYGPTECTCLASSFHYDRYYDCPPVGKPAYNTDFHVLDDFGRLQPVGVEGELYIAGTQVALGYKDRPELTEKAFLANPFYAITGSARMYKTGDTARWRADGNLEILGRRDLQIKIRGFRVELGEIEKRILAFDAIESAVVVPAEAPASGKCAIAYVVAKTPFSLSELRTFITDVLPMYMLPAAIMQVDNIPLTPNGKVDARALPAPEFAEHADVVVHTSATEQSACATASPQSRLQGELAHIVASVLGHNNFSVNTNLLRAGLASLSAIMVMAHISEHYGLDLPVNTFLTEPTILTLESLLVDALLDTVSTPQRAQSTETQQNLFPLSESQMGVYYACAKQPDSTLYNIPFRFDLDATQADAHGLLPDATRLQRAVLAVVDAHPVLKTHFVQQDGILWQGIEPTPLAVNIHQCRHEALEAYAKDFVRPFTLLNAPLCRIHIVCTEKTLSLFFDAHHCIFDGMSVDLFLRELQRAYAEEILPPAQAVPILFDVAQKAPLTEGSEAWLRGRAYIQNVLGEYGGVCALAADVSGEYSANELSDSEAAFGNKTGERHEHIHTVDKDAVQAFCKAHGITEAALFLAASVYTLHRFLALDAGAHLYLATINNGRNNPRLLKDMGMFVRTVPLALALPDKTTRHDFLTYTQHALRQSIVHEDYPFTRISQEYGFEPAIMYACELGLLEACSLGGQNISLHTLASAKPKFPLSINVQERQGQYVYALHYDSARYSAALMKRLGECMVTALFGIINEPTTQLSTLSLVNEEQRAVLRAFGQRPVAGELDTFTAVFEAAAKKHAQKTALIAHDATLTYDELNVQANRLAHALLKRGVHVEDRVAFMLERTSLVLIAILGIVKAGCAFVPIDPTYPKERIVHVLEDSSAPFLLVDKDVEHVDFDNALHIRTLLYEETQCTNPIPAYGPDNLAYVIYTSGSTGKPKGVMIGHGGIANYVSSHKNNLSMYILANEARSIMSITTVAFDMFLSEAFGALMHGLTFVFADEEATHNPVRLAELFAQTKPDVFSATPSRLLEFMENDDLREAILACTLIMAGGEKYPPLLFTHLKRSQARLFNGYGPTEITVACNATEITDTHITVGAPLHNVREYVVDRDGNDLPIGLTGELLVGGRGVAKGYLNLPEETAKRFIVHNHERVYRTGDLATWTEQGTIVILGRNDGQIKLRGLRIELGEIEKNLNSLPEVKSAVVIVRHVGHEEHLCAYCMADAPLDFTHIRQELAKNLTHYMVPTAYIQMDTMPKTPNGKLDVKALPLPSIAQLRERTSCYEEPQGELEKALCTVFGEVLKLDKVGATDNFFEQGGTSLGVTRLLGLVHKRGVQAHAKHGGQKLSYTNIFAFPTPRLLAKILHGEDPKSAEESIATHTDIVKAYDYSGINKVLANNTLDALHGEESRPLGNVLFTGATGFLGITLLYQFLKNEQGRAYCLLRKGRFTSAEKRLTMLLYYYFAERFDALVGTRIIPIEGDVTENTWFPYLEAEDIHTVFNCAANVRHFAHDDSIERVNVDGAKRCIELCHKTGARLIHVSTVSVAGFSVDGQPAPTRKLHEQSLYYGQHLENQYVRSKFLAERAVLEATLPGQGAAFACTTHAVNAIDAKIMRVGNLTGRASDGEFQINAKSNSFSGRLRALSLLGHAPFMMADEAVDLSPVDSVAEAILLLSRTPRACCLFHPVNNHAFLLGDLIDSMIGMGIPVHWGEVDVFNHAFEQAREAMSNMEDMVSLVAYQNMTQGHDIQMMTYECRYTVQTLKRLGWQWPFLGKEYHMKFLEALNSLGYFDKA